jgi:putative endonuclease
MSPVTSPHLDGKAAEALAHQHLKDYGLRLLERNYRCRTGEIDLIMQDAGVIAFIEVRYRRNDRHGSALESVNTQKQRRLYSAAQHYLLHHPAHNAFPCRFDVVGISPGENAPWNIQWIKNAFQA